MKTIRMHSRVGGFVSLSLIVFLLQAPSATAGRPMGAVEKAPDNQHRPVNLTFTKWITAFPLMSGFVGGDVTGDFSGEVLQIQASANGRITRLEAMYEVEAGGRSFAALVRGGQDNETGKAILDGVILSGWRTGAQVHVEYEVKTDCAGAPAGLCFQGAIHVERPSKD